MKLFAFGVRSKLGLVVERNDGTFALWGGQGQFNYSMPKELGPHELLTIGQIARPLGDIPVDDDMRRAVELAIEAMINSERRKS